MLRSYWPAVNIITPNHPLQPALTGYVSKSSAFKAELERLHTADTREEPVVFPRTCAAALSFIVALVADGKADRLRMRFLNLKIGRAHFDANCFCFS